MPRPLPDIFAGPTPLILTPWLLAHMVSSSCLGPRGDPVAIFSAETIASFHWLDGISPCSFHCWNETFRKLLSKFEDADESRSETNLIC